MLITFTHDFHSIKKGMGVYIKDESEFPIRLCEETFSSERVRALEHLWMVCITYNAPKANLNDDSESFKERMLSTYIYPFINALRVNNKEKEKKSVGEMEDFDNPNAPCTWCPTCEWDPSYHDDIWY